MVHSLFLHGKFLIKFERDLGQAEEVLSKALQLHDKANPDGKNEPVKGRLLYTLGNAIIKQAKAKEARPCFEQARAIFMKSIEYIELVREVDGLIKSCCDLLGDEYTEPTDAYYQQA